MSKVSDMEREVRESRERTEATLRETRAAVDRQAGQLAQLMDPGPEHRVWLAAYLAIVKSCPDILPAYAAERADEAVKLYRERFGAPIPEEVRT